eukprot:756169-Hanusia_phi.AAC.1
MSVVAVRTRGKSNYAYCAILCAGGDLGLVQLVTIIKKDSKDLLYVGGQGRDSSCKEKTRSSLCFDLPDKHCTPSCLHKVTKGEAIHTGGRCFRSDHSELKTTVNHSNKPYTSARSIFSPTD